MSSKEQSLLHTPYLNSDLLEYSKNLLNKLKEIENNEQYKGVWAMNYIHGGRYDGPNYAKERDALEETIKRLEEQSNMNKIENNKEVNITFTAAELKILLDFLDDYNQILGNSSCNDYAFNNEPELRNIIESLGKEYSINKSNKVLTYDFIVLQYFINKLIEASPIPTEFQKTVLRKHFLKAKDDYEKGLCEEVDNPFSA